MLTPAYYLPLHEQADATASRLLCRRKLGSSEAEVNYARLMSNYLFKVAYVIRESLFPASYGLCP